MKKLDKAFQVFDKENFYIFNEEHVKLSKELERYNLSCIVGEPFTMEGRVNLYTNFLSTYAERLTQSFLNNIRTYKCGKLSKKNIKRIVDYFNIRLINWGLKAKQEIIMAHYKGNPPNDMSQWFFLQGIDRPINKIIDKLKIEIDKYNQEPHSFYSRHKNEIIISIIITIFGIAITLLIERNFDSIWNYLFK